MINFTNMINVMKECEVEIRFKNNNLIIVKEHPGFTSGTFLLFKKNQDGSFSSFYFRSILIGAREYVVYKKQVKETDIFSAVNNKEEMEEFLGKVGFDLNPIMRESEFNILKDFIMNYCNY